MKKTDLLIGVLIGLATPIIGFTAVMLYFSKTDIVTAYYSLKSQGSIGKIITMGAVLNLIPFFVLLKFNKELMARGVVLSVILLAILTLFI
jgi:hypothetical protein